MKKMFWAIGVLILFIVLSVLIQNKIINKIDELKKEVNSIAVIVGNEQWDEIDTRFEKLYNTWNTIGDKLAILIEHEDIERTSVALGKAMVYTHYREKEEALAELKEFELMIDHIPKAHNVSLKNIL